MAKELNKRKTEQKIKDREREGSYLGHLPGRPSWQPTCAAQPTWPLPCRLPLCQEDEQRRGVAHADAASATSCLPACRWRHPRVPRTPLDPLHLSPLSRVSPSVPIPLCSLSLPRPSGARRRRRRYRGRSHSEASPTRPRAPPRPPLPPHRAKPLGKLCFASTPSSSSSTAADGRCRFVAVRASPNTPRPPLHST